MYIWDPPIYVHTCIQVSSLYEDPPIYATHLYAGIHCDGGLHQIIMGLPDKIVFES